VTGQQLSQDEILLRPAEQPWVRVSSQRSGLTQDAEAKRLMSACQRLCRGATDTRGDALAQVSRRGPGCRQNQALTRLHAIAADPVDDKLDGGRRLARPRGAQDAQHTAVQTAGGG
jgi:hypothetical protein